MICQCFLLLIILLIQRLRDLSKVNEWALEWKMSSSTDPTTQAQEIILILKTSKKNYSGVMFQNKKVNLIINNS